MIILKRKTWFLELIFLNVFFQLGAQDVGDKLFDNSVLHEIRFESSDNGLWQKMENDQFLNYTYRQAKMTIDNVVVDSIAVRKKGFSSAWGEQIPLKIDINKYVKGNRFDGLKKFTLSNNYQDRFRQRDAIAYTLYRRSGLVSPRTAYAEVYFNDSFKGIYSIVEQIDKTFLKENFPSSDGSLYKGKIMEGVEAQEGDMTKYNDYENNVNADNLSEYVNMRNYLKFLAIDVIIEDWDSFGYGRHNYYLYYEPKSERLNYITWDHNFAFDLAEMEEDVLYPSSYYAEEIHDLVTSPNIKPLYQQTMCELLDYLIDETFVEAFVQHNYDILSQNTQGLEIADSDSLVQYLANRKEWLEGELKKEGVDCKPIDFPIVTGDIVINEFVAKSDSIHGIKEPDGGTPDWIELYNNTNSAIVLDERFYLSDDKDFPKKWHFDEEVTIAANDYLVVWADRDVHQEGIHAGFKIAKSGGELLMTYEDLTPIENISYENQVLNQGYARVPNGTGSFKIQSPTFAYNNEQAGTGSDDFFSVYPNPVNAKLKIDTNMDLSDYQIGILNSIGEIIYFSVGSSEIDMTDLPAGLYFLSIANESSQQTIRVIKY